MYPQPPTKQDLIDRQNAFEAVFSAFAHADYIRYMDYCTCYGQGCELCSGHGWRHNAQSIAFGQGLNAPAASLNPYSRFTESGLHNAYHYGKGARSKSEVARIRAELGITDGGIE